MPWAPSERYDASPLTAGILTFGQGIARGLERRSEQQKLDEERLKNEAQKFQSLSKYLSLKTGRSIDEFTPMSIGQLEGEALALADAQREQEAKSQQDYRAAQVAAARAQADAANAQAAKANQEAGAVALFRQNKPFTPAPTMMQGVPGARNAVTGEQYDKKYPNSLAGLAQYNQDNPVFSTTDAAKAIAESMKQAEQQSPQVKPLQGTGYGAVISGGRLFNVIPLQKETNPTGAWQPAKGPNGEIIPGMWIDPDGKAHGVMVPDPEMPGQRIPFTGQPMGTSAQSEAKTKPAQGGYKVGVVYSGLKYLGGDPNDPSNWEKTR